MKLWKRFEHAWQTLFRRRNWEQDMADEMRFHREAQEEANLRAGLSAAEAKRAAALQFGAADAITEAAREARGFAWLTNLSQDFRYGLRMLLKHRGFTFVAVMTLALGLSANMTIFSVIDVFYFQPAAVKDPGRLVVLSRYSTKAQFAPYASWLDYQSYRDDVAGFRDAVALFFRPAHLSWRGRAPERSWIEAVSANYFSALGAQPAVGRLFLPGEAERPGADPVIVLSYRYWRDHMGADLGLVGRPIDVNGVALTVIGVAGEDFGGPQWSISPAGWVPATMIPQVFPHNEGVLTDRAWSGFRVFAHLADGYDVDRVNAELAVVDQRLAAAEPRPDLEEVTTRAISERFSRPDPSISGFLPVAAAVFMGLVLMILGIACANVANLLFARAASRQRELGIRAAIGASRGRLTRQLLTESLMLAALAGVVGWVLSSVAGGFLAQMSPRGDIPLSPESAHNSGWVVVASVGVSLLAGLVTGLMPALRATRINVQAVMKSSGAVGGGRDRHRLRNVLVVSQVAFCAVVLVAGGLFLRSLRAASDMDLGFDPEQVAVASIDLDLQGYSAEKGRQLLQRLSDDLNALPSVEAVGLASLLPLNTSFDLRSVASADAAQTDDSGRREGELQAGRDVVDARYFSTMRVPLSKGRSIQITDTVDAPRVAVVNEALAAKLWPGEDALGKRFKSTWEEPLTVVGVVRTGKYVMIGEAPRPYYFVPLSQDYQAPMVIFVRSRVAPDLVLGDLRQVLQRLDPALPVYDVRTMEEHLRNSAFGYMPLRMAAYLAGAQGLVGLLLAVMGVYSVVAFSVSQRTREIGIRVALGAARRDVFRLVVGGGLRLIVIGLLVGLVSAFALSQLLAGLLMGLNPLDVPVFGGVTLLLLGVSGLACYLPARRAMAIDPAITLKCE